MVCDICFESEGLKVDYLSLNLQFNNFERIKIVANFLHDVLNCQCILVDTSDRKRHLLIGNNRCLFTAEFVVNLNKYWYGTTLRFKGRHAELFYSYLKSQTFDWSVFDLEHTNLGRIDLCYDRKLKECDKDLHLFFKNSFLRINSRKDNLGAKLGSNILRIGKRSSSNFFRVYLKSNGKELRFEIELKKTVIKNFQHYLFTNQFNVFEELLVRHFYTQATKLFDVENPYCDWLLMGFRRVRQQAIQELLINSFSTSYLVNKLEHDLAKVEFSYRLIQLLNYIKYLGSESNSIRIGDKTYKILKFPVNHFLEFIGKPKNNHYQVKKLVKFLKSLQKIEPITNNFSDGSFRSYVVFPYLKVERKRSWWVELYVCQELCSYRYPFHLPETFLNYHNDFELKVKFVLLKYFCTLSINKEFPTQEFLEQVSLSNSKNTKLKYYIVSVLHQFKDYKIIEPEFQILTKQGKLKRVESLTTNLVSRSKSIFYKERI